LIVLSFLGLISITSQARRETISKIIQFNTFLIEDAPEPLAWNKARDILGGMHAGLAGHELEAAIADYDLALARFAIYDASPAPPAESDEPESRNHAESELRRGLGRIVLAYSDLLRKREAAFDSLYSFLVIGVFIQSFALMVTLGRIGTARAEIMHRDTMLALVQKVREDERHSLASYLHDSVIQELGSLGLRPSLLHDPEVRGILNNSIDKLRRITYSLAPLHLEQAGLVASLKELIAEHARHGGSLVEFTEFGHDGALLDSGARLVLYRAVQEGLANIRKYADAGKVELRLVASHPYLILTLRDDGRGFDPKEVRPASGGTASGLGLALLSRQVQSISGELTVESATGAGTRLQIRLLQRKDPHEKTEHPRNR